MRQKGWSRQVLWLSVCGSPQHFARNGITSSESGDKSKMEATQAGYFWKYKILPTIPSTLYLKSDEYRATNLFCSFYIVLLVGVWKSSLYLSSSTSNLDNLLSTMRILVFISWFFSSIIFTKCSSPLVLLVACNKCSPFVRFPWIALDSLPISSFASRRFSIFRSWWFLN